MEKKLTFSIASLWVLAIQSPDSDCPSTFLREYKEDDSPILSIWPLEMRIGWVYFD